MPPVSPVATRSRWIDRLSSALLLEVFLYLTSETRIGFVPLDQVPAEKALRFVLYAPALDLERVCRTWKTIVTSAPSLWSTVQLLEHANNSSASPSSLRAVSKVLEASKQTPLHVTLLGHGSTVNPAIQRIFRESKRWASAGLYFNGLTFDCSSFRFLEGKLHRLRRLRLISLDNKPVASHHAFANTPQLYRFEIWNRGRNVHPSIRLPLGQLTSLYLGGIDYLQTMTLLSHLPKLEVLEISGMGPLGQFNKSAQIRGYTSGLRSLAVSSDSSLLGIYALFHYVDMPRLEAVTFQNLCVKNADSNHVTLSETLLALAPPKPRRTALRRLSLRSAFMPPGELRRMLKDLPSLTYLDVHVAYNSPDLTINIVTPALISALQEDSTLLPELTSLTITAEGESGQGMNFAFLLQMARARSGRKPERRPLQFGPWQRRVEAENEPRYNLRYLEFSTSEDFFLPSLKPEVEDLRQRGVTVCLRDMCGFVNV